MPSEISIAEVLELLEGPFSEFAQGFGSGLYALWLGSGISRERVVGLDGVLEKLLDSLRIRVKDQQTCAHYSALTHILDLAELTQQQKEEIDLSTKVGDWPHRELIIDRLWGKYSKVLGIEVEGQRLDYLLWDVLDFKDTFSSQAPDAEHIAIGILVLEGVVSELATANWDALLEGAMNELGHPDSSYVVAVKGDDLKGPPNLANLYKFHGCAKRAIEDEATYRPLLVAREAAISQWGQNPAFDQMRIQLDALVRRLRTLMIGLSAQDTNIQAMFGHKDWNWTDKPTPIVISALTLSDGHKSVLEGAFLNDYDENREQIFQNAKFPAFAKPLLLALVLHVLAEKLAALIGRTGSNGLDESAKSKLVEGVKHLRDKVATAGDADRFGLSQKIGQVLGRTAEQFAGGKSQPGVRPYSPVHSRPANHIEHDVNIQHTGKVEAAVALGAIGLAVQSGQWSVGLDDPTSPNSGALKINGSLAGARIFLASSDDRINGLLNAGAFGPDDDDVVVLCSGSVTDRQQRSARAIRRDGSLQPRYVAMEKIIASCSSLNDFRKLFASEVGL